MDYATPSGQAWLRYWVSLMPDSRLSGFVKREELNVEKDESWRGVVDAQAAARTSVSLGIEREKVAPRGWKKKLEREVGDVALDFLDAVIDTSYDYDSALSKRLLFKDGGHNLQNVDFYLLHDVAEKMLGGDKHGAEDRLSIMIVPAYEQVEAFWPIDIAVGIMHHDEFGEQDDWQLIRFGSVLPKDVRGFTTLVVPRMGIHSHTGIRKDNKWQAENRVVGLINGVWRAIDDVTFAVNHDVKLYQRTPRDGHERLNTGIQLLFGKRLSIRYEWHVAFGDDTGPRAVLPTNPRGCLELFKTRDSAPGERRRAALRHWVNEHYRSRSDDEGIYDYVCEHLRGNSRFVWNGIPCELMVSEFDQEKNEYFRQRAKEWRSMRKHNSIKVRVKKWK